MIGSPLDRLVLWPTVRVEQHILDLLDRDAMLCNVLHVATQVVFQIPNDHLDVHQGTARACSYIILRLASGRVKATPKRTFMELLSKQGIAVLDYGADEVTDDLRHA